MLPSPFLSPVTLTRAKCSHSQLLMPDPESGLDSDGASAASAFPLPDIAFSSPMSRGTCLCDASCGAPECTDHCVRAVCLQRRMLLARRRTQRNRWPPRINFHLSGHSRARAHTHTHTSTSTKMTMISLCTSVLCVSDSRQNAETSLRADMRDIKKQPKKSPAKKAAKAAPATKASVRKTAKSGTKAKGVQKPPKKTAPKSLTKKKK